jgi:polyribonucleotide nucleotidyltransferase
MDAGVPITAPVAGVAMGLVKEQDKAAILTDIQGMEDDLGDMDFKVAGTAKGVTAIQMDIKIGGLADQILERALEQARQGRMFILGKMLDVLPSHRTEMSPHAPRVLIVKVPQDKIREVIGPGGKIINGIIEKTRVGSQRVEINIEDDGTIYINAVNRDAGEAAKRMILAIVKEPEVGEVYLGKVVRLMPFGAFVELTPGKDGLVHISQFSDQRINKVEDVVSVGDEIWVKVVEVDNLGRVNLSHKEALRGHPERERAPRS